MKCAILAAAVGSAYAGNIELSTNDLTQGNRAIDNIKASWSQGCKVFGNDATVSAAYDRAAKRDFLKDVSVRGNVDKVRYELTTNFEGASLNLETSTDDGTKFEMESNVDGGLLPKFTKLTASRDATLRGQECNIELSHEPDSSTSKLRLSTALGSGVKAVGLLTSQAGDSSVAYEVEYDTTLNPGRTLSAKVRPADGSGEIEYEDTTTLDGTLTATIPLGGAPRVSLKRSFGF